MDVRSFTAQEGGDSLASFGSGNQAGRAASRARGRAGRAVAPAGAHRSLRARANRLAATPGRGRAARRALLQEIDAAAQRRRGGPRLTNAQVASLTARLRALGGR